MHHCSSLLKTMLFYRGKVCNNLKSVLDKLFTESDLLQGQSKSFSQTGLFLKQVKHVKSVIVHIVQPWPQRPSYVEHSTYNVLPRINDFQNKFDARLAQIYTLTDSALSVEICYSGEYYCITGLQLYGRFCFLFSSHVFSYRENQLNVISAGLKLRRCEETCGPNLSLNRKENVTDI